ncbi:hypothetical protein ACWD33_18565 [Streptomyces xiamenensis]|uniref:hypothetical protein n=1 Tax=Streptomyces xiamenensis TaxID=408015 RepID=UPI0035DCD63C
MLWSVLSGNVILAATGGWAGGGEDSPGPDVEAKLVYIWALERVDPDIVHGNDSQTLSRARAQCGTIEDWPDDVDQQVMSAEQRFTSPDHPYGFGPEIAAQINELTREYICT